MARRIVDYIFKVSRDDVGPRFNALTLSQRGFTQDSRRTWASYERFAKKSLSSVSKHGKTQFQKLGRDAKRELGGKIAAALSVAGIGVAIKKSITNLADLGKEMTGIAIKLGRPVESLEDTKKQIEGFSLELGIEASAGDIARGVNLLVGADFKLADALNIVRVAAKGASIAQTDVATITKGLSDVMSGFEIPAEKAEEVLSKMIKAGDLGKVELRDLSGAMGDVIPAALKMGASLDQVLGFLAALSISGVSNVNEVSTSVGRLFARFSSSAFRDAASDFGINITEGKDNEGQLLAPLVIMELIKKKMEELEEGTEQNDFLEKLIPEIRADRALTPLLGKMAVLGKSIDGIGFSASRFAEAFKENLKRLDLRFTRFHNLVSFMSRDFATLFVPGVNMFSDFIDANFNPEKGAETLSDQIREMLKLAAETAEKEQWGLKFWELVLLDPLKGLIIHGIKTNTFALIAATAFSATSLALKAIDNSLNPKDQGEAQKEVFIGGERVTLPRKKANEPPIVEQIRGRMILMAAQSQRQEIRRESKQGRVVLHQKIEVNNKIDSETGKTRTTVTTTGPLDIERRIPLGVTP